MSLTDKINQYAQQEFGANPEKEVVPVAEMALEQPETKVTEVETIESSIAVSEPIVEPIETATAPTEPQTTDYNAILDEMSGGAFKSVEDFKTALPRFAEYNILATQKAELEEKLKVDPFANDYIKKLNEFVKGGASVDQIKNFQKVNEIGDPNQLSPIEAKITKMVMVDGYNENIARKIVEDEYPLEVYDEGSNERIILEEKLRVSSKSDANELSKFIADATKVDTSAQQAQEAQRLQAIAQESHFTNHVNSLAPQIAQTITGLGEINLNGKEGDEAINFAVEYPQDYRATIPEKIAAYFLETKKRSEFR